MVLTREYRICMPLTVEEYRVGQLYMIARHSHEQSDNDEGVEVIENCECVDPEHGRGRFTEKRIHLSSKLPYWIQSIIPRIFYVTEKAWNYYPFTITEYTCSFIPKFFIHIKTRYEDNNGKTENVSFISDHYLKRHRRIYRKCLNLTPIELVHREVDFIDIAYDEISAKHYKEEEDPKFFKSKKTARGPLIEGWKDIVQPIMCSYKLVNASFEVWGMQTRVEDYIHRCIRDILLLGHRQAFAWIDDWYDMTFEDVREYEKRMQAETNERIQARVQGLNLSAALTPTPTSSSPSSPTCKSPTEAVPRSWFSWS